MAAQIRFWMDAWKNPAKSLEAGRPIYDTVAWFEKRVPGEQDTISGPVHRSPKVKQDFAAAWAAFERDNASEGAVGTMLEQVPWIERGEVENLRYSGIKTLEALASVSDANVTKIPGGLKLRERAQAMLKASESAAPIQALGEEVAALRAENESLRAQMAEFLAEAKRRKRE